MALDANKNRAFHLVCRDVARALLDLHREVEKQAEYFTAQVSGQPAFQNTEIATTAELTALFSVVNDFRAFMNEGAVNADAARRDKLQPFVAT